MKLRTSVRTSVRTASITLLALGTAVFCFAACGDDSETGGSGSGGDTAPFTIEGTDELFPGFEFSTGLQPEIDSPVKASFEISAKGATTVSAQVAASGSKSKPVLTGIPGEGKIVIDGGFAMIGTLVSTIPGYPYNDDIPGLDNIEIPITGEQSFDPFSIDEGVTAVAEIPETDLPGIPLPGGIPGELIFHVGKGSTVEMTFTGTCAGIEGDEATYSGSITRAGKIVLEPRVVVTLGLEAEYEIGSFEIDLSLGATDLAMESKVEKFGGAPAKGDKVDASCNPGDGSGGNDGAGGGGQGGSPSGPSSTTQSSTADTSVSTVTGLGVTTGGGQACEAAIDCPNEYPCVEGTCSDGTGVCDAGLSFGEIYIDNCISVYCCTELAACTYAYADLEQCNDCLAAGGGSLCDPYIECASENCSASSGGVCDSGIGTGDDTIDACLGAACCTEFTDCTQGGADLDACVDCFSAGGGPICDAAIACADGSGC